VKPSCGLPLAWTTRSRRAGPPATRRLPSFGRQIELVEKKFSEQVDGARGAAEKQGRKYKAIFTGLSEANAKEACHTLKSKRLACLVIEPA